MILFLSGALMIAVAVTEAVNFRIQGRLTFLSVVHGLIVIGYCLPPFLLHFLPGTAFEDGIWGYRLYALDLAERLNLPLTTYLTGWLLIAGGYATLLIGYVLGRRLPVPILDSHRLSAPVLVAAAVFQGATAIAALAVYASQFNDFGHFIGSGMNIRGGRVQVRWGYLQVLTQWALPAFILALGMAPRFKGPIKGLLFALAVVFWTAAALRTFHTAGRFELGSFLTIPVLAWLFTLRSKKVAVAGIGATAVLILFAAMAPHNLFRDGHTLGVLSSMFETLGSDAFATVLFILGEYAYPHLVAAHTVTVTPDPIATRYFVDIPLGFLHMLPSFSGIDNWPPMILSLHIQLLPWIPVDLVSFGYYSLGTIGVLITFAAFGAALAVFDGWLTWAPGWLSQAFRAAWLFYLPFRLFYADPYVSAQVGFGLISATLFLAALHGWAAYQERNKA